MIKLNAGISRKVGEPDYGSRGASVNMELEVESNLVNDPNGLMDRIRRLFALAREAVDQELNPAARTAAGRRAPNGRNGAADGKNGNTAPRPATASQLNAIRTIAEQLGADPEAASRDEIGVPLSQLTLRQASDLIDRLKSQTGARR